MEYMLTIIKYQHTVMALIMMRILYINCSITDMGKLKYNNCIKYLLFNKDQYKVYNGTNSGV